jgi:hypothetical protein
MRWLPRLVLMGAALGAGLPAHADTAARTARRLARVEGKETELLGNAAFTYWDGLRWADPARAGSVVDIGQQEAFREWYASAAGATRYEDISVLALEVAPSAPGAPREARVRVRVRAYTVPAQILFEQTIEQRWVRTPAGWVLPWAPPGT